MSAITAICSSAHIFDRLRHQALVWGPIADRLRSCANHDVQHSLFFAFHAAGRVRATGIWSLAVFRFVAGVGIGGEWLGWRFALVSEDWPEECGALWRGADAHGLLLDFFTGISNIFIGSHYGWRAMFALGGVPALLDRINSQQRAGARSLGKQSAGARREVGDGGAFLKLFSAVSPSATIVNSLFLDRIAAGLWAGSFTRRRRDDFHGAESGRTAAGGRASRFPYSTALLGSLICPRRSDRAGSRICLVKVTLAIFYVIMMFAIWFCSPMF